MQSAPDESAVTPDIRQVRQSAARWRRVLCVTVLFMTAVLWFGWMEITSYERRRAIDAAGRRQANLAISVEHYLTRALGNADGLAQYLSTRHLHGASDFPQQLAERARANTLFAQVTVCYESGTMLAGRASAQLPPNPRWCAEWLHAAPAGARTFPALPVQAGGDTFVPLLTRLERTDVEPAGVIALLVDVRGLLGVMQEYAIADETVVLLAADDGRPRARWHSILGMADQRAPEADVLEAVLAEGSGAQLQWVEGRPVLASARPMRTHPLTVLITTSERDTLAEPNTRSTYYGLGAAAATLVIGVFTLLLLRLQGRATSMAEALGRAHRGMQRLNDELEEQVRVRTSELEAANRDLEAFSYSVAHDVRAPISAIRGFAEVLAPTVEAHADAKAAHYLRRIVANATQMSELVESLLALGKLSRSPIATVPIDLSAMAHEVLAGLRERETAQRAMHTRVQDGIQVQGDRVLVRQVLENLLGNAWKFSVSRSPASIAVEAREPEDGWTTVTVRDNGEGFDASAAAEVFQPFRRMHAVGAFPGTGVGLATVERILRLHGGRVWLETSPQAGTSVHFTLRAA